MESVDLSGARRVASLSEVRRPSMLNELVCATLRISEQEDVTVIERDGEVVNAIKTAVVQDRDKDHMPLITVVGDENVDAMVRAFKQTYEIELYATVVLVEGHYCLALVAAKPITSVLQLIGAEAHEVAEARETVARITSEGGISIIEHILLEIVDMLGVQGIETFPSLRHALTGTIYQAASHGRVLGTPASPGLLMVGPPSVGKGVVQRAAAITSPVFHRISSNRVTPAGLTGFSERAGAHRSRVIPGKLALASWGTAAIEDLQHVDTHSRRHTFGILSDMLELGRLIRTTHHDIDIAVETALLADVNPRSTTRPADADRELVFLKDLDLPINFLSRLDLIVLFDRNMDRQIKMMHSIVSSIDHVGPEHDLHNDPRARRLRNLLAYLRDTYPEIDVRPAVQLTNEKLTELLTANSEHLKGLDLAADFIVRGAKSLMKLIAASARLHARDTATDDDVRLAFELYECKMKFISKLEPSLEPVKDWKNSIEAKIARQQRILEHFMGQEVLISAIERMFSGVTRKTITRDLSAIGATHRGQGVWTVPTNGIAR